MTHYLLHRAVFNVLHNLGHRNLLGSALLTHEGEKEHQHANHDDYPDETIPEPLVICHVMFLLFYSLGCRPGWPLALGEFCLCQPSGIARSGGIMRGNGTRAS